MELDPDKTFCYIRNDQTGDELQVPMWQAEAEYYPQGYRFVSHAKEVYLEQTAVVVPAGEAAMATQGRADAVTTSTATFGDDVDLGDDAPAEPEPAVEVPLE